MQFVKLHDNTNPTTYYIPVNRIICLESCLDGTSLLALDGGINIPFEDHVDMIAEKIRQVTEG